MACGLSCKNHRQYDRGEERKGFKEVSASPLSAGGGSGEWFGGAVAVAHHAELSPSMELATRRARRDAAGTHPGYLPNL